MFSGRFALCVFACSLLGHGVGALASDEKSERGAMSRGAAHSLTAFDKDHTQAHFEPHPFSTSLKALDAPLGANPCRPRKNRRMPRTVFCLESILGERHIWLGSPKVMVLS